MVDYLALEFPDVVGEITEGGTLFVNVAFFKLV